MSDWKTLELFEREAQVLAQLNHPGIPHYLHYFQVDTTADKVFYIAQQLVEGRSLAELIESGWHCNEAQVKQIAAQVLDILDYLHALRPPVIHRDIKPQNLIRQFDGKVLLVDFGAVQEKYRNTLTGSTVVGTYGYMAPEQFRAKAFPATDLYGLGATLLFLLTGRSPSDFPQTRLKIDFRSAVDISTEFAEWLEQMLEPAAEDRFASAKQALAVLQGHHAIARTASSNPQPLGSRIKLHRTSSQLAIDIPPAGRRGESAGLFGFALFWNAFMVVWTTGAAIGGGFMALFSIPFWIVGIGMLYASLSSAFGRAHLQMDRRNFLLQRDLLGFKSRAQGKTADISKVELGTSYTVNDKPVMELAIKHGVYTHKFGHGLTQVEKEWLVREIGDFLENLRRSQ